MKGRSNFRFSPFTRTGGNAWCSSPHRSRHCEVSRGHDVLLPIQWKHEFRLLEPDIFTGYWGFAGDFVWYPCATMYFHKCPYPSWCSQCYFFFFQSISTSHKRFQNMFRCISTPVSIVCVHIHQVFWYPSSHSSDHQGRTGSRWTWG